MIASFAHNFVFVRTHKTASTTTEIVMAAWCGPDDIVAPLGPPEHELLRADYGGGRAQNFCSNKKLQEEYYRQVEAGDLAGIERVKRQMKRKDAYDFNGHKKAKLIKQSLPDLWATAYKFAVDRHPYEKVISRAWNNVVKKHDSNRQQLSNSIDHVLNEESAWNYKIYMDGDKVLVDKLFRLSDIWKELERLSADIGATMPPVLPRARGEHERPPASAADLLSNEQKSRIYDSVGIEFELFGWER